MTHDSVLLHTYPIASWAEHVSSQLHYPLASPTALAKSVATPNLHGWMSKAVGVGPTTNIHIHMLPFNPSTAPELAATHHVQHLEGLPLVPVKARGRRGDLKPQAHGLRQLSLAVAKP